MSKMTPPSASKKWKSRPTIQVGYFHVGNLGNFPELITELGGNPKKILTQCGIDIQILQNCTEDVHRTIPIGTASRLLALAAKEVACPHFGLLLGQRVEASLLGPIGFLMQHSTTVDAALQNLMRFLRLRAEGVAVDISTRAGVTRFTFDMQIPVLVGSDQTQDLAMANFVGFMRMTCGKNWFPSAVYLRHETPADVSPYRDLFGESVRFNQRVNAVLFPAACLSRPIAAADPGIGKILQSYVVQIEEKYKGDIVGQIRRLLPTLLPTGKCTIERLAELFAMHRRTLHRHLDLEGLTFEYLLDETRREMATNALANEKISISELASLLGYRDSSAFSRAFRRWTGMAPSDWRAETLR